MNVAGRDGRSVEGLDPGSLVLVREPVADAEAGARRALDPVAVGGDPAHVVDRLDDEARCRAPRSRSTMPR